MSKDLLITTGIEETPGPKPDKQYLVRPEALEVVRCYLENLGFVTVPTLETSNERQNLTQSLCVLQENEKLKFDATVRAKQHSSHYLLRAQGLTYNPRHPVAQC